MDRKDHRRADEELNEKGNRESVGEKIDRLTNEVRHLRREMGDGQRSIMQALSLNSRMINMVDRTLDEVVAQMAEDTTVSAGIATMIDDLRAKIEAAGGNQEKINAIFDGYKANTDMLAAKLVVNTPEGEVAGAASARNTRR